MSSTTNLTPSVSKTLQVNYTIIEGKSKKTAGHTAMHNKLIGSTMKKKSRKLIKINDSPVI